jgi:hypothetical protein
MTNAGPRPGDNLGGKGLWSVTARSIETRRCAQRKERCRDGPGQDQVVRREHSANRAAVAVKLRLDSRQEGWLDRQRLRAENRR